MNSELNLVIQLFRLNMDFLRQLLLEHGFFYSLMANSCEGSSHTFVDKHGMKTLEESIERVQQKLEGLTVI